MVPVDGGVREKRIIGKWAWSALHMMRKPHSRLFKKGFSFGVKKSVLNFSYISSHFSLGIFFIFPSLCHVVIRNLRGSLNVSDVEDGGTTS